MKGADEFFFCKMGNGESFVQRTEVGPGEESVYKIWQLTHQLKTGMQLDKNMNIYNMWSWILNDNSPVFPPDIFWYPSVIFLMQG